jgi:hypothetical protein
MIIWKGVRIITDKKSWSIDEEKDAKADVKNDPVFEQHSEQGYKGGAAVHENKVKSLNKEIKRKSR